MTVRDNIVKWAKWGVENHAQFTYTEGPTRMAAVFKNPGTLPISCDCSAWVTICYRWAGAPDPNGLGYNGYGYTGSLLANTQGVHIAQSSAQPGDIVVYGNPPGVHTAIIVEAGADPLTVSMGQQGDPNFCRVSQDGRTPRTYIRYVPLDVAPKPKPAPSPKPDPSLRPEGPPPVLHLGSVGPANWMSYLKHQLGFFPPYHGAFGPTLYMTLRKFQKSHDIPVTGKTDARTWEALR